MEWQQGRYPGLRFIELMLPSQGVSLSGVDVLARLSALTVTG